LRKRGSFANGSGSPAAFESGSCFQGISSRKSEKVNHTDDVVCHTILVHVSGFRALGLCLGIRGRLDVRARMPNGPPRRPCTLVQTLPCVRRPKKKPHTALRPELDITTADDILDFEFRKFGVKAKLLHDARVLARSQSGVVLRLGVRHNHLPRGKNKCSCFGVANPHDDSGETLSIKSSTRARDVANQPMKPTLGLYSALRACNAMVLRSKRQSRFTVATMF
jgi:hypothetical protein